MDVSFSSFTPQDAYVGQEVVIGIEAVNRGAEDITTSKLVLSTERGLFAPFQNVITLPLEGKVTTHLSEGEKAVETFTTQVLPIPATDELETTLRVDVCYPYVTVFSATVCIDTDILNENRNKPRECPPRRMSFGSGQGAPVAVVKMEPFMRPSGDGIVPVFDLEIANVGRGEVYDVQGVDEACSSSGITQETWGYVDVSNIYLGSTQLDCQRTRLKTRETESDNEFYDGATIRCTGQPISATVQPYLGSVTATLQYGYKESATQRLTLKQNP